jgi:integrase family protein with SAM-like domain
MLDQFINSRDTVRRLRSGVLGAHLESFAEHLANCGYAAATARSQLTLLRHFDQWMGRRQLGLGAVNDELVGKFVHDRTRLGKLHSGESVAVRHVLTHLRAHGIIPSPAPVIDETPLGRLQRQYEQYLVSERGLAPVTVTNYGRFVREFLTERFGKGPMDVRALDVSTVTTFVVRHAPTMSPGRAKLMVTVLRSMFQFLLQRGAIERDLAACVPRMADWRLGTIPKYLSPNEVERLLQACDRQTAVGRRDQAILLLLARLGLRERSETVILMSLGLRTGAESLVVDSPDRSASKPEDQSAPPWTSSLAFPHTEAIVVRWIGR